MEQELKEEEEKEEEEEGKEENCSGDVLWVWRCICDAFRECFRLTRSVGAFGR